MSVDFFIMMKYAATGQASHEMTHFDKMRALSMAGGGKIETLTGVPPLSFKANGKPLISFSMLGNGQQGTPSPDNPVPFDGVGERTDNLINLPEQTISFSNLTVRAKGSVVTFEGNGFTGELYGSNTKWKTLAFDLPAGTYTINRTPRPCSFTGMIVSVYDSSGNRIAIEGTNTTFTLQEDTTCSLGFYVYKQKADDVYTYSVMLNSGSTVLPFEPFGYKIPITCAGTTTPVYLGQVSTVRKIGKYVFTGNENITRTQASIRSTRMYYVINAAMPSSPLYCTHFLQSSSSNVYPPIGQCYINGISNFIMGVDGTQFETAADFKAFLQQQYAAGTPVTVWYVLAEPTTGIINEPLAEIGDYADELHITDEVMIPTIKGSNTLTVDTDLPPSEMTITYK